MYLNPYLTEEQALSRVLHEEDESAIKPDDKKDKDIIWYKQAWFKELRSMWFNPPCPNCNHSLSVHGPSSGCAEWIKGEDVKIGECWKQSSSACTCPLSQADIIYNLFLRAGERYFAEIDAKIKSQQKSQELKLEEARKLAELKDLELGHNPYFNCCEEHNKEYNGPGRVPSARIQFRVNSEGTAYPPMIPEKPFNPYDHKVNPGYDTGGYCDA